MAWEEPKTTFWGLERRVFAQAVYVGVHVCKNSFVCLALCKSQLSLKRKAKHSTGQCASAALVWT